MHQSHTIYVCHVLYCVKNEGTDLLQKNVPSAKIYNKILVIKYHH